MPNITYKINYGISDALETWLTQQPNFVSFSKKETEATVVYNHADTTAQNTFKKALAGQMGLSNDNVNEYASNTFKEPQVIEKAEPNLLWLLNNTNTVGSEVNIISRFKNNSNVYFDAGYIVTKLNVNTAGAEKTEYQFWNADGLAFKVRDDGNIQFGPNQRVILSEAGLTAPRTYTFPDADTLLGGGGGGSGYTYAVKTSDQTLIGTAYADVSGTGLAVAANTTYEFEFNIIADADATTTGIDIACNGPAIGTGTINYTCGYWTSATAMTFKAASAYDFNTASTASNGTARAIFKVEGILRNGANAGTLIARTKREAVGTGPNARAGSYGRIKQI